jgi:protein-S-isoprenylcysteine O-methyltransferase Ste14
MSILGIGPIPAIVGVVSAAAVIVVERLTGWSLPTPSPWRDRLFWLGVIFIVVGAFFWVSAALIVKRAFEARKLATRGVYHLSRKPMYAGFNLFIIPGITFVWNDLRLVLISVCTFVAFSICVGKEEKFLAKEFGSEFEEYRKAVQRLVPFI